MKKKNGFTLIELLAVIIILGILMIIAIPSVTSYISESRKSAYVDTAKEVISGVRNVVNEGKLGMYSTDTTYYIPVGYIKGENAIKSPYGDFTQAYVAVIYDGKGYSYYWISVDDAGQGVPDLVPYDKLDTEHIKSDLTDDDIRDTVNITSIDDKNIIKKLDEDTGNWDDGHLATRNVDKDGNPTGGGSGGNSSCTQTEKEAICGGYCTDEEISYYLNESKTVSTASSWVFQDGQITQAIPEGKCLIVSEGGANKCYVFKYFRSCPSCSVTTGIASNTWYTIGHNEYGRENIDGVMHSTIRVQPHFALQGTPYMAQYIDWPASPKCS